SLLIPRAVVTTTSPRFCVSISSVTASDEALLTGTSFEVNPTDVMTSTSLPAALIENFPASFVVVTDCFPLTATVAPATGLPPASDTVPLTVCALAKEQRRSTNKIVKDK